MKGFLGAFFFKENRGVEKTHQLNAVFGGHHICRFCRHGPDTETYKRFRCGIEKTIKNLLFCFANLRLSFWYLKDIKARGVLKVS